MKSAAEHFLNALNEEERQVATFEFDDAQRTDWHFIPKERKGLIWNQMSGEKKTLAHALLASGLSTRGYIQSTTIMTLEKILQDMEGPNRRFREIRTLSCQHFRHTIDLSDLGLEH